MCENEKLIEKEITLSDIAEEGDFVISKMWEYAVPELEDAYKDDDTRGMGYQDI